MECRKCKKPLPDGAVYCLFCGTKQEIIRNRKKRANGTGCVIPLKSGKWRAIVTVATWTDADGKIHQKRMKRDFVKRADALNALGRMKEEVSPTKVRDITLHDLYDTYVHSRDYDQLSKSQQQKLGYAWKRWGAYEFRGIGTLTVDDIESEIERQVSSFYPARDMKVCLSHLYDIAIKKEVVNSRKTDYADIPYDQPKAKRECWTEDEINLLWTDVKNHDFTSYILIMCYAGLRYGELSTIPLENIDLEHNIMVWGIKSEAGIDREIPIHPRIKPLIEKLILRHRRGLLEMNEESFYSSYWNVIDRTGLRHLPPHTCRHYFFSRLTAAGVQGGIIAEVGGHASYLTTLKNYVRIPFEDKLNAVKSI